MFVERMKEFLERFIELLVKTASVERSFYDDWWM